MPSPRDMPAWMDSPSNRGSTSRWLSGRPPPSHPSNFVSRLLGDNHRAEEDEEVDSDEDEEEEARRSFGRQADALEDADLEQQALDERAPLLPPDAGSLSASVLSPSTGGQAALLRRRNFRGLRAKRAWTDAFFLGWLAVYWIGMLALAITAFSRESNVSFAKYIKDGVDFKGQSCGAGRFVYFPDFQDNPDFGVCVDACPERAGEPLSVLLPLASGQRDANGSHALQEVTFTSYATHPWTYVCAPAGVETEQLMISQLQDTMGRFVGALSECWIVLVVSCGITLGTAALYLLSLRYLGCLTVVLSTLGIQTILTYAAYRLLTASSDSASAYADDPAMRGSIQFGAIVMSCAAILFALFAVVSMPRLLLAGAFITHASRALTQLKKLLLVPFVSYGALILLFWWGLVVTVCLFGAGETSTRIATVAAASPASFQIETEAFRVSRKLRWLFLYHAWGMYWSANFLLEVGEMITATAVSLWYFSPENRVTGLKDMRQDQPVMYSVNATLRYHLGTVALSSGVVGPVEYVRAFFLYLENKNEFDANAVTELLAKCCCCCIWCFKRCLKYICKEAMYITAIQGTGFYSSGKLAYTLISSNLLRVGALSRIGHSSVLLGKLIVCTTTCFVAWFLLIDVSSPLLPLIVILLFSYGVASAFMTIYETTINMLLMCFTLDENMHGGRGNAAFASAPLLRSVNDHLRPKWQTDL